MSLLITNIASFKAALVSSATYSDNWQEYIFLV